MVCGLSAGGEWIRTSSSADSVSSVRTLPRGSDVRFRTTTCPCHDQVRKVSSELAATPMMMHVMNHPIELRAVLREVAFMGADENHCGGLKSRSGQAGLMV